MTVKTEGNHDAEFLLSEAQGERSRRNITVVSGQNLVAGTVVGKITSSGKYTAYDDDNNDGSEAAAGVLLCAVDATDDDKAGVIIDRDAEVKDDLLVWASSNDATDITNGKADLEALGIRVRENYT
jgi:hypothetical protein